MKYDLIIFDFDGTIAETKLSIINTVKETLKSFRITSVDEHLVQKLIGLPLTTTFKEVANLKGIQLETAIQQYRLIYYDIGINDVKLFQNAKKTLVELVSSGINLAIASNRGKKILNELLNHLGVAKFFSFIVGEQDVENTKPAPDAIYLLLKELNIPFTKTLVVGDTMYDIKMGKRANCDTCGVTYGYDNIKNLRNSSPTYIIDTISELLQIIK